MAACEALARDEGHAAVVLSTGPDMYAAQRVYRAAVTSGSPTVTGRSDGPR
jgi:hypothetical protein